MRRGSTIFTEECSGRHEAKSRRRWQCVALSDTVCFSPPFLHFSASLSKPYNLSETFGEVSKVHAIWKMAVAFLM